MADRQHLPQDKFVSDKVECGALGGNIKVSYTTSSLNLVKLSLLKDTRNYWSNSTVSSLKNVILPGKLLQSSFPEQQRIIKLVCYGLGLLNITQIGSVVQPFVFIWSCCLQPPYTVCPWIMHWRGSNFTLLKIWERALMSAFPRQ